MSQTNLRADNVSSTGEQTTDSEDYFEKLINVVPNDDIETIEQIQRDMLNKFEKTNEMLVNCNALGQFHYNKLSRDYKRHTQQLLEMHKDLDFIFHRIRFLKQKLKIKYPQVEIDTPVKPDLDEEEEKLEESEDKS